MPLDVYFFDYCLLLTTRIILTQATPTLMVKSSPFTPTLRSRVHIHIEGQQELTCTLRVNSSHVPEGSRVHTYLEGQESMVFSAPRQHHASHVIVTNVDMHLYLFTVQQQRKPLMVIGCRQFTLQQVPDKTHIFTEPVRPS